MQETEIVEIAMRGRSCRPRLVAQLPQLLLLPILAVLLGHVTVASAKYRVKTPGGGAAAVPAAAPAVIAAVGGGSNTADDGGGAGSIIITSRYTT